MKVDDLWFPYAPRARSEASTLLFCFAHASGAASAYRTWSGALGPEVEVHAVQLPGRENRLREPLLTSMAEAVDRLTPVLEARIDRPFAIYGHSLGGLLGYEVAVRLQKGGRVPSLLAVSGRRAPQLPAEPPLVHQYSDDGLVEYMRAAGGTPEAILREPEMLALLLPVLRADITMLETNPPRTTPLDCDILAFRGTSDRLANHEDVERWREVTSGQFGFHEFDAGHFFAPSVVSQLQQHLLRHLRSPG